MWYISWKHTVQAGEISGVHTIPFIFCLSNPQRWWVMTTTKVSTGISYSQCFLTHWNHGDLGTRLGFGPRHVDRSQKDSRHRPTAASSPAVKGHKKALHAPLHPPEPWLQSGLIISKPGGREGARFGGDGNPAWVTSDPSGELGTNTAKQPHPVPAT